MPSFLEGLHYIEYDNALNELCIVEEIYSKIENIPKNGWESVDYKVSSRLADMITNLIDIQCIENYIIRTNKKEKRVGILCVPTGKNTKNRWIDVNNRAMYLGKNVVNLTMIKDIDDELKHLEIIANLVWFT